MVVLKSVFIYFYQRVTWEPLKEKTWFQSHIVEQLKSYPMVVKSWESRGTKMCNFLHQVLFRACADSMHKNVHRGAREYLQVIGLEQEESKSCSIFWSLSGVLEVKYDLDRTGMKRNFMHWNVTPDALPGSKRLVHVLDRWLNN